MMTIEMSSHLFFMADTQSFQAASRCLLCLCQLKLQAKGIAKCKCKMSAEATEKLDNRLEYM
jgi:hypothetical protein